jgi:hypothetical protein
MSWGRLHSFSTAMILLFCSRISPSRLGPVPSARDRHQVYPPAPARCCSSSGRRTIRTWQRVRFDATLLHLTWEPPFPGSYLAAVTDFTEMVSPLAVPVTLASSQASLLRLSSAA